MTAATPTWVRIKERANRVHAIYAASRGGYFLYCSRFVRLAGVKEETPTVTLRCRCCQTRVKLPYLVPKELVKIREEVCEAHA